LRDRFLDFFECFFFGKDVRVRTVSIAVERAEFAFIDANIRVVDIPVYDKRHKPFGMKTSAHSICKFAQREEVRLFKENKALVSVEAIPLRRFLNDFF
jgi:hypothetical protein